MNARRGAGALAALVALALAAPEVGASGGARGTVIEPTGTVEHYVAAFHKWKGPLRGQVPIYVGDRVRTGPGSTCKVVFSNREGKQDSISVGPDTLLEVPDIRENLEEVSWIGMFSEAVGRVVCAITRRPPAGEEDSPFNVRTPTVVAGVRGTEFSVEYDRSKHQARLKVLHGVVKAVRYGGALLGLLSKNQELASDGVKAWMIASQAANLKRMLFDSTKMANVKYNREFHVAEAVAGKVTIDGRLVDESWALEELPWDGPGRTWEEPMVVTVAEGGRAILHLRNTGWFMVEGGSELSCYRMGNAFLGRLRKGTMSFRRADPNMRPLRHGPKHEVEIFMAKPDGDDLRVVDYTPKGGITEFKLDLGPGGRMPSVDVIEGKARVRNVRYE